jgi:hypothetical protein
MIKRLLFLATIFTNASLIAQQRIPADQANQHIGDSLSVCGKVFGGVYLKNSTGQSTLLYLGGAYGKPLSVSRQ